MLYPIENCFDFYWNNKTRRLGFMFCGYGEIPYEKIEDSQIIEISAHAGLVVIANCSNGDYICFDYREDPTTCNPPIVVVLHDHWEKGEDSVNRMVVCDVAKDFEAFIDILYKPEE